MASDCFSSKHLRRRRETSRCPSGQCGHLCSYCSRPGRGSHIAQNGDDPRPASCGHGFGAQGLAAYFKRNWMELDVGPSKKA